MKKKQEYIWIYWSHWYISSLMKHLLTKILFASVQVFWSERWWSTVANGGSWRVTLPLFPMSEGSTWSVTSSTATAAAALSPPSTPPCSRTPDPHLHLLTTSNLLYCAMCSLCTMRSLCTLCTRCNLCTLCTLRTLCNLCTLNSANQNKQLLKVFWWQQQIAVTEWWCHLQF